MNAIHPPSPAPANRRNAAPVDLAGLFRSSIHARIEADPHVLFPSPYTRYTAAGLLRLAILAAELERPEFIKEPRFRDWPLPPRNPRPKEPYFKFFPHGYRPRRRFPRNSPVYPPSDNRALFAIPLNGNTPDLGYHFISALCSRLRMDDPALLADPDEPKARRRLYWRLSDISKELSPLNRDPDPIATEIGWYELDETHDEPIHDEGDFEDVLEAYRSKATRSVESPI